MYKVNNLTYEYSKENKALDNINMDFSNGNIIGIIGSNGSGKSTLFMNLMGILKPTKGYIFFNEKMISYNKKSIYNLRKKVGMVFQDPEKQIFYSKVFDDIAFALRNLGIEESKIKERVRKSLMAVNGLEFINTPVHFLSYGQKKRIAIASIIAMENEVILLDEPTSGLDPINTRAIVNIINGLKNSGIKVIISSHDMNLIYEICEYIYVLDKGTIVTEGRGEEIFLEEEKIINAGLELPWLIKLHKNTNLPIFKDETSLYKYCEKNIKR